jgi:hypothetical protein
MDSQVPRFPGSRVTNLQTIWNMGIYATGGAYALSTTAPTAPSQSSYWSEVGGACSAPAPTPTPVCVPLPPSKLTVLSPKGELTALLASPRAELCVCVCVC